jgi:hypothetical protein
MPLQTPYASNIATAVTIEPMKPDTTGLMESHVSGGLGTVSVWLSINIATLHVYALVYIVHVHMFY